MRSGSSGRSSSRGRRRSAPYPAPAQRPDRSSDGAAALTAGAIALVRSKFPTMSGREVVQRIIASTLDAGLRGVDQQSGYGVLRPYHALIDHVAANAPNPVYARWDQTQRQETATATPPGSPTARASAAVKPREKSGGPPFGLLTGIGVGTLCALGCVVVILLSRGRRRESV